MTLKDWCEENISWPKLIGQTILACLSFVLFILIFFYSLSALNLN